ncbi:MAG: hypothetical protein DHS20C15_08590 [Planctomycetota bacterium]|nr:MAG: hypothetical protein DHS20C15_08590 [Planctomycetota bacterium]
MQTPYGRARADTADAARALADLLEELGPAVRASLPDSLDRPTEVWLEDFGRYGALASRPGVVGLTSLTAGHIRIRADRLGLDADFVLVHELVHALLGPSWEPLPAVITEGLCDAVAARLAPEAAERVRAVRLLDTAFGAPRMALELRYFEPTTHARASLPLPLGGAPALDPSVALELPGRGLHLGQDRPDATTLYGYGLFIVERIFEREGVEALHALCLRAVSEGHSQVPAAWLLDAADLDPDPTRWRHALLEGFDDAALRAQVRYVSAPLADWLVASFRSRFPELDAADFLARCLPSLGWQGSDARVVLSTVPGFAEGFEARWHAQGPTRLLPGEGWWLRDDDGVHLTTILGPTREQPGYTLTRLRMAAGPLEAGSAGLTPDSANAARDVEAYLRLHPRDGELVLSSSLPGGFEHFRVELDGFVVAELSEEHGLRRFVDERGWPTLEVVLTAPLRLHELVLYHEASNLIVSQRAAGAAPWETQHFPIWLPRQR